MRPSKRKEKREHDKMVKNIGAGAAIVATIGGAAAAAYAVSKKKRNKTEDSLEDVVDTE